MQYAIWMRIYRLFPISYYGCTNKQSLFRTKEGVFSSEPEKYSVKIIVHCFVYYKHINKTMNNLCLHSRSKYGIPFR